MKVQRQQREKLRAAGLLLASLALLLLSLPAAGREQRSIGLVSFEAEVEGSAVRVVWEVATENETAGYKLKRGQNGAFANLPGPGGGDLFIVAQGGAAQGFTYDHLDEGVSAGATYAYQLVEVTNSSQEVVQAETSITVNVTATATAIVLPTAGPGGGNAGQNPTATPTAGAATATARPSQPTAVPAQPTVAAPAAGPTVTASADTTAAAAAPTSAPAAPARSQPPESDDAAGYPAVAAAEDPFAVEIDAEAESAAFGAGVAEAQEAQPDAAAYPGPQVGGEDTVVAPQPAVAPGEPPAAQPGGDTAAPVVIGGAQNTTAPAVQPGEGTTAVAQAQEGEEGGLAFLWIAFLAALTIFVAAVIGAIILYTRRQAG